MWVGHVSVCECICELIYEFTCEFICVCTFSLMSEIFEYLGVFERVNLIKKQNKKIKRVNKNKNKTKYKNDCLWYMGMVLIHCTYIISNCFDLSDLLSYITYFVNKFNLCEQKVLKQHQLF